MTIQHYNYCPDCERDVPRGKDGDHCPECGEYL